MRFLQINTVIRSLSIPSISVTVRLLWCCAAWLLLCWTLVISSPVMAQPDFGSCDGRIWIVGAGESGRETLIPVNHEQPEIPLYFADDSTASVQAGAPAFHSGERSIYAIGNDADGVHKLLRVYSDGSVVKEKTLNDTEVNGQPVAGVIDTKGQYFVATENASALYRINLESGALQILPLAQKVQLRGLTTFRSKLYGLTEDQGVVLLDTSASKTPLSVTILSGVDANLALQGLFSAAGGVYGYDADGRVYQLHSETGAAKQVTRWERVAQGRPVRCLTEQFSTSPISAQRFHMNRKPPVTRDVGDQPARAVDIYVQLNDQSRSFTPGGIKQYNLTVGKKTPGDVRNLPVNVPIPKGVTDVAWRCIAEGDARCTVTAGTGPINTAIDLFGGTVRFIVDLRIPRTLVGTVTTAVSAAPPPGVFDPDTSNNSASDTNTRAQGDSFGYCDSRIFIHQGAGTTNLLLLEPGSGTTTFIGNSPNVQYNAAAYNPNDDFIYAISSDYSLIRIASDGSSEVVKVNIVPAANWVAGTFASDGFMYVTTDGAQQNVYRIDVTLQDPFISQQLIFDTTEVTGPGDLAFYNGLMYTVDTTNNQLRSFNVVGAPNGSVLPVTEIGNGYTGAPVTSMWSGTNGVFGADDAGNVYQYDLTTGVPTRVGSAPVSSVSDGSHCNSAPFELTANVRVEKVSVGDVGDFRFRIDNVSGNTDVTLTTTAEGVPAQSTLFTVSNPGQSVKITEGESPDYFVLTDINCSGYTGGNEPTVDLAAGTVTFDGTATQPGADILCTFTNEYMPATLTIEKVSIGGTGTFSFSDVNAGGSPTITTVEEGVPVQAPEQTIVNPGQSATVSEPTLPDGFTLTDITCTGLSEGGTADVDLDTRRVTIDGAGTQLGADIVCTFTNIATPSPNITLQKALPNGRFVDSDQFDLTISGTGGTSATTQGAGTQVSPAISATNPVVGQSYTLSEAGNGATNLANYATSYACTNALSGGQTPSGNGNSFSFTLNQGDQITCTFTNTPLDRQADLAITKTDSSEIYIPGTDVTYQVVATNNGPDNVSGASVTDALPPGISIASWSCSASGGASCGVASGTGALSDTPNIPVGGTVTYAFTISVPEDYSGGLANTASVAVPDGYVDPNPDNDTATDVDNRAPAVTIEKITQGDVGTFGFSGNNGIPVLDLTTTAEGVVVASQQIFLSVADTETTITEDMIPDTFDLTAVNCTGLGSGGSASVDLASASVTLDTAATAPNTDIVCTFTNTRLTTDLAVTKTAPVNIVQTGDQVTYTLTVDNLGPLDTTNAVLTDTPDNNQDCSAPNSITCSASGGAQCPAAPINVSDLLGSGVIIPSLPANSEVVFTVVCDVTGTGSP